MRNEKDDYGLSFRGRFEFEELVEFVLEQFLVGKLKLVFSDESG